MSETPWVFTRWFLLQNWTPAQLSWKSQLYWCCLWEMAATARHFQAGSCLSAWTRPCWSQDICQSVDAARCICSSGILQSIHYTHVIWIGLCLICVLIQLVFHFWSLVTIEGREIEDSRGRWKATERICQGLKATMFCSWVSICLPA